MAHCRGFGRLKRGRSRAKPTAWRWLGEADYSTTANNGNTTKTFVDGGDCSLVLKGESEGVFVELDVVQGGLRSFFERLVP